MTSDHYFGAFPTPVAAFLAFFLAAAPLTIFSIRVGALFFSLFPFLQVPEDIFQHHDGVIQYHTDTQGETAQGNQIKGIARKVDGNEGSDNGKGDGDGKGKGCP